MKPKRIQRKRTKGFKLSEACTNPNGYVIVSRPSKWGNPFKLGDKISIRAASGIILTNTLLTLEDVKREFESNLMANLQRDSTILHELKGKDLVCWCSLESEWCHADTLLIMANKD